MKAILGGHVLKNYKLMWLLPALLSKVRKKGSPHLIPKLLEQNKVRYIGRISCILVKASKIVGR